MKKHLVSIKSSRHDVSCIDDMEAYLNHIEEFKQLINTTKNRTDPGFVQEVQLFKQYVAWKSEDLTEDSHIYNPTSNHYSSNS